MKSFFFFVIILLVSQMGFANGKNTMDSYIGCYETLSVDGNPIKKPSKRISTIEFNENNDGHSMIDPNTNKPLPYYKIELNSDYPLSDSTYIFWNVAFLDRGTFILKDNYIGYTFNGKIKLFPDGFVPGMSGLAHFLYNFEITKISQNQIRLKTELTDLGMGTDCRDYNDCRPIGAVGILKKVPCK